MTTFLFNCNTQKEKAYLQIDYLHYLLLYADLLYPTNVLLCVIGLVIG